MKWTIAREANKQTNNNIDDDNSVNWQIDVGKKNSQQMRWKNSLSFDKTDEAEMCEFGLGRGDGKLMKLREPQC